eukprot:4667889-Prymnesium_polylepis.2
MRERLSRAVCLLAILRVASGVTLCRILFKLESSHVTSPVIGSIASLKAYGLYVGRRLPEVKPYPRRFYKRVNYRCRNATPTSP